MKGSYPYTRIHMLPIYYFHRMFYLVALEVPRCPCGPGYNYRNRVRAIIKKSYLPQTHNDIDKIKLTKRYKYCRHPTVSVPMMHTGKYV